MGSRKQKKIIYTQKIAFLCWYKSLSINEKIAFKWFAFADGRRRWTLQDLLKPNNYFGPILPYCGECGILLKDAIQEGYSIRWQ